MTDQEDNVEKSGEFKELGGVAKTISTIGWVLVPIGLIWFGVVWIAASEEAAYIGIPISIFGFLIGQTARRIKTL